MPNGLQVAILSPDGATLLESALDATGTGWETHAWGGFGGGAFTVKGAPYDRYRRALHTDFAQARIYDRGGNTLYEGSLDTPSATGADTTAKCLGFWAILEETPYTKTFIDDRITAEVWRLINNTLTQNIEVKREQGKLRLSVKYGTRWGLGTTGLYYDGLDFDNNVGKIVGSYAYVEDPYHDSIEPTVRRLDAMLSNSTGGDTAFSVSDDASGSFTQTTGGGDTWRQLTLTGKIASQDINFGGYYLELSGLEIWNANVSNYYGSDVAKAVAALLASPLTTSTTNIQTTSEYAVKPLYFELGKYTQASALRWCGALGDTSNRPWYAAIWDGGALHWYPRDTTTVGYVVRPEDIEPRNIQVSRDKQHWANKVTVAYKDAEDHDQVASVTSTHATYAPATCGRTRHLTIDGGRMGSAAATQVATTALTLRQVPPLVGKVTLTRPVYDSYGSLVPLCRVRAGRMMRFGWDTAAGGFLPSTDHWLESTDYDADNDTCRVEIGLPDPSVDLLLARAKNAARIGIGE